MSSYNWSPLDANGGTTVTTINGLSGALTLAAGTGIAITDDGISTITISSTSAGDVTLGAFGSTPNANGLSLSGSQVLNMQPANGTNPGGISLLAQVVGAGTKTFENIIDSGLNANTALIANGSKQLASSATTSTELGYVSGVTSAIQTQLDSKQATLTIGNLTDVGTDGITVTGGTGAVIGSGTSIAQHVSDATHNGYLSSTDWSTFNSKQSALSLTNLTDAGTDGIVITNGTGAVVGSSPVTIAQHVSDSTHNGYLSSTDWSTFNGKQAALSITNLTDVGTDGITITNGTGAVIGASPVTIAQQVADATHNGYLSSANWSTFNGKQAAGNYITALTGDGTASGPGSVALTLAATQNNITSIPNLATVGTVTSGTWSATTIALNKGGTGQTTKAAAFDALQPMTTGGDLIYGGASGTGTRLANGSAGQVLTSGGTTVAPSWAAISTTSFGTQTAGTFLAGPTSGSAANPTFRALQVPTYQVFSSGTSQTYTTPAGVLYLIVRMTGGGGGGGSSGTGSWGSATAGGVTTFGNLTANNGAAGGQSGNVAGGSASGGAGWTTIYTTTGGYGGGSSTNTGSGDTETSGGTGGNSPLGFGGAGGAYGTAGTAGTGTGSGGGGGGQGSGLIGQYSGGGGSGGGYVEARTSGAPSASYTYSVGAAGAGGSAGTNGFAGGAGQAGYIIVEEYYQ